jgi:hypothetical protein
MDIALCLDGRRQLPPADIRCVAAFYQGNGFARLPDPLRLILPTHVIRQTMEIAGGHDSNVSAGSHRLFYEPFNLVAS